MKNTIFSIVSGILFLAGLSLNINGSSVVGSGSILRMIAPAYADNSSDHHHHHRHHHNSNDNGSSGRDSNSNSSNDNGSHSKKGIPAGVICRCGTKTGNAIYNSNGHTAGNSNAEGVDGGGQDKMTNEANDRAEGDGQDHTDNSNSSNSNASNSNSSNGNSSNSNSSNGNSSNTAYRKSSPCTCVNANGKTTTGYWTTGGTPVVPGASSVPSALREIHGQ